MPRLSPREAAEKHARRLKNAIEDIRKGVERVNEAPTVKAAEKIDKMKQRLLEAFENGKVERGLRSVTLDEWKRAFLEKGLNSIAKGVDLAKDKLEKVYEKMFDHIDKGLAELEKMPDLTLEDSIRRVEFWMRHMHKFKK